MKILIIGNGGREDAFCWKFQNEANVEQIYVCPGHIGMKRHSKVELLPSLNFAELANFAKVNGVELTVVGPEAPLTDGVSDLFEENGLKIFGPKKNSARLEGSKIFSKRFMEKYNIPTAAFQVQDSYQEAQNALLNWPIEEQGLVIKADGLAGGKGVVVTYDRKEAEAAVYDFMVNPDISVKSESLLFEHVLPGEEVSTFALCNSDNYFLMGSACDHKRLRDDDKGPNTGGMGCFRDPQWPDQTLQQKIIDRVLLPTLKGCIEEGMPYTGFLFMGLMIDNKGDPYVVEYNVRMGDPETQTLFPLLQGSLSESLLKLLNEDSDLNLKLSEKASVHVVATSGGYPSLDNTPMSLNHPIEFNFDEQGINDFLFLAGVNGSFENGVLSLVNSGGRVLGVTSCEASIAEARGNAYKRMEEISFKDKHQRSDIGLKKRG